MIDLKPGDQCFVNGIGDLFMDSDARPFINQRCVFLKKTKAGLMQVALAIDPKQQRSFSLKNISMEKS